MGHVSGAGALGVMSGGAREVEQALSELRDLGVRGWVEPVPAHQQDWRDMPRFNVFVDPADRDTVRERSRAGMSQAALAAADADHQEQLDRVRRERPQVEVWLEDVSTEAFDLALRERMTVEQAMELRRILEDDGPTWRALARRVQDRFSDEWRVGSLIAGHQAFGIALCHVAAEILGEDPSQHPWI